VIRGVRRHLVDREQHPDQPESPSSVSATTPATWRSCSEGHSGESDPNTRLRTVPR
jgi:hypothetical protein